MMFALASVILNLVLALALFFGGLGFLGLALATSAAGWLNALLLAGTLSRRGLLILDDRFKHRLPRLALASLMMGASVYATASLLPLLSAPLAATIGADWVSVLGLAVLVTVGGGVYALACVTTGALRIGEVIEAIRPMKGAPPPAELE
jgi:putative peptidoglycan lipid II flippase